MEEITSKERILREVRSGLMNKLDTAMPNNALDKNYFYPLEEPHDLHFAKTLSGLGGKFIFVETEEELKENLISLIKANILSQFLIP